VLNFADSGKYGAFLFFVLSAYLLIERPFIRTRLARRLIALPTSWDRPR
jgi:hypothetical protein